MTLYHASGKVQTVYVKSYVYTYTFEYFGYGYFEYGFMMFELVIVNVLMVVAIFPISATVMTAGPDPTVQHQHVKHHAIMVFAVLQIRVNVKTVWYFQSCQFPVDSLNRLLLKTEFYFI